MSWSPYTNKPPRWSHEAKELVASWWYPATRCQTREVTRGEAELLHGSIVSSLSMSASSKHRRVRLEVAAMRPSTFMRLMTQINDERETGMSEMQIRQHARQALAQRFDQFKNLLPTEAAAKRFCSIMVQQAEEEHLAKALSNEVGRRSFVGAALQCAEFQLEPSLGQAWLIPYKGVVQFQLGYKGMLELAYRSGHVTRVDAQAVYANDEFEVDLGEGTVTHKPPRFGDRGDFEGVYAIAQLKDGGSAVEMMSVAEVDAHAKQYSETYGKGWSPWSTAFVEMAKKTVLKRLLKSLPASIQDKSSLAFVERDSVVFDDSGDVLDVGAAEVVPADTAQPPQFDDAPSDEVRAVITEYWNGNHDAALKLEGELTKAQLKWVAEWTANHLEAKQGAA